MEWCTGNPHIALLLCLFCQAKALFLTNHSSHRKTIGKEKAHAHIPIFVTNKRKRENSNISLSLCVCVCGAPSHLPCLLHNIVCLFTLLCLCLQSEDGFPKTDVEHMCHLVPEQKNRSSVTGEESERAVEAV